MSRRGYRAAAVRVVLLGTGGADGWPNPFCRCASCTAVRGTPDSRGQTSALVDGVLLLDCGAGVPTAAGWLGVSLDGVRHLLLTHAHIDHTGPAALLMRRWAGAREPLEVAGPAEALAACRDWVGPDDPVRWRPLAVGDTARLGGAGRDGAGRDGAGYQVRALPAGHPGGSLLYDVTGPDGARLLYATDTGPLPAATRAAVAGAGYDLVLLEETAGTGDGGPQGHLDLVTFPRELAALRASGGIAAHTRVLAVHLSHGNPPPVELARRLAGWGVELPSDGTVLEVRPGRAGTVPADLTQGDPTAANPVPTEAVPTEAVPTEPVLREPAPANRPAGRRRVRASGRPGTPWRTLVLGGARSGKSVWAEASLAAEPAVVYVATAAEHPDDPRWTARLAAHRARRPAGWRTIETIGVAELLADPPAAPLLVDDVGNWLTRALDEAGAWTDPAAVQVVGRHADELVEAWRTTRARVVAVTNEVGSGVVPATTAGGLFRDELGRLNSRLAAVADEVVLLVAGLPSWLRGAPGGAGTVAAAAADVEE